MIRTSTKKLGDDLCFTEQYALITKVEEIIKEKNLRTSTRQVFCAQIQTRHKSRRSSYGRNKEASRTVTVDGTVEYMKCR